MRHTLLCPVPCVHIPSAFDVCHTRGRVAFGTMLGDWFGDTEALRPEEGWPVLIYPSRPELGDPEGYFSGGKAPLAAIYAGWQQANDQGKHPNPKLRPHSTESDGASYGFWEVRELVKLKTPILLSACRLVGKKTPIKGAPRRPIVVLAPES